MKNKVTTEFQAGKAQIFKSPALEKLTNTNPFVNIAFYGLAIIGLILTGLFVIDLNAPLFIGLFVSGILFWTLIEYLLHRFIFHGSLILDGQSAFISSSTAPIIHIRQMKTDY